MTPESIVYEYFKYVSNPKITEVMITHPVLTD